MRGVVWERLKAKTKKWHKLSAEAEINYGGERNLDHLLLRGSPRARSAHALCYPNKRETLGSASRSGARFLYMVSAALRMVS